MPELPEVETVVRGLRDTVLGETIAKVRVDAPKASIEVGKNFKKLGFEKALEGKKLLEIKRRGKNILIALSDNTTLWVHLKMTGHFFYMERSRPRDKHDLVVIDFKSSLKKKNGMGLRFNDYRRFGRLRLYPDSELWEQKGLKELGPEPLEISVDDFLTLCRGSRRMMKPALLDQSFLAGLGNIYADESLHLAKVHPKALTDSVSRKKLTALHGHIQDLLKMAISKMGTSVDTYSGVNGQRGEFQKYLRVYNNEGNPCGFCGRAIVREKIGSRSAHYCPKCQRV